MKSALHWKTLVAATSVIAFAGCDRDAEEEPLEPVGNYEAVEGLEETDEAEVTDEADDEEALAPEDDPRRETVDEADQQLRQRMMGRVMEVAEEDGFDAAVHICHDEAEPITEEVAEEFDVEIGRVADRLRNPDNVGHDWVWEMIDEADGDPLYAANDEFRAVKPIELGQGCVNCHGETDQLAPGVADILDTHYPEDEATGYEPGDLRGWVWVEVPE